MKLRARVCVMVCLLMLVYSASAASPNSVLICTDDRGYGDVSVPNANSKVQTPHMSALSEAGDEQI